MAHNLVKIYKACSLDTRSNNLLQSPNSLRSGSKNFRWNYNDQLQKIEGIQHKTAVGNACEAGLIEYKYKDINTGESQTEILGVSFDGKLRRRKVNYLYMARSLGSPVKYFSIFYDASVMVPTHKIVFYNSSGAILASIDISLTMTLDQLKTAINNASLGSFSADVVSDTSGLAGSIVVGSTVLAYLLDTVYMEEFEQTGVDLEFNPAYYWEEVATTTSSSAPFSDAFSTLDLENNPNWPGVSYQNLNQACYITAGTFVFKYDGAAVYRAGLPDLSRFYGFPISNSATAGSLTTAEDYKYAFQIGNKDRNGVEVFGKPYFSTYPVTGDNAYQFTISGLQSTSFEPNRHFPIFSMCVDGDQTLGSSNPTITVKTGHNIVAGMCLRFHLKPTDGFTPTGQIYHKYMLVSSVTATSITLSGSIANECFAKQGNVEDTSFVPATPTLWANTVVNGAYVPDYMVGQRVQVDQTIANNQSTFVPSPVYGAYFKIGRTIGDQETFYHLYDAPIPHDSSWEYTFVDTMNDAGTTVPAAPPLPATTKYTGLSRIEFGEIGQPLPRCCHFLSNWQQQLIQGGRPFNFEEIVNTENYPKFLKNTQAQFLGALDFAKYQENDLCDYQSIYWDDPLSVEGFPQSGLFEESFENGFNDEVTGAAPNKEALFVFKRRTTAYLSGTLATGDIVKEFLETDAGSANQNSIQEVMGSIIFMDENMGFWSVVAGRLPEFIGYPIQDTFKNNYKSSRAAFLNFRRAKATNFKSQDQYICYIPAGKKETGESAAMPDPTSSSIAFIFDYSSDQGKIRAAWYAWQGINADGGILATADDKLLLSQRETSNNRLWQQKFTGSIYDFSNHTSAIDFVVKNAFLNLKEPVIDKSWTRVVINSVLGGFSLVVSQYANFIDTSVGDLSITFGTTGRNTVKDEVKANVAKLSGLSWGFSNNVINEDVKIDGWEVEYAPVFDRGEPKR